MFARDQYEFVDFGEGRKLERFGALLLDRPAPAAEGFARRKPGAWNDAAARYERREGTQGEWRYPAEPPARWAIAHERFQLELKLTDFGHVGVFPEQAENWDWIRRVVSEADRPLKVLNLFAYTGGSTLAAAAAGAEVTHVDAVRHGRWARRNAELSQLAERPIRWIAEDAAKFVAREVKRGKHYDGIILDPPSYGHGPKGEVWKVSTDLRPLLEQCRQLTGDEPALVLVTCHSPNLGLAELLHELRDTILGPHRAGEAHVGQLTLDTSEGRRLLSGNVVRWPG